MSQSDYIKYKRVSNVLRVDSSYNKLPPVLASQDYTNYSQYSAETLTTNSKTIYSRITASGEQMVFDMGKKTTGCPSFIRCKNTNLRPNRVPMLNIYYTPKPVPQTIDQINNSSQQRNACKCAINSKNTNANICSCKTGSFGIVR